MAYKVKEGYAHIYFPSSMTAQNNKVDIFEFLIGDWEVDYRFPMTKISKEVGMGKGLGPIQQILETSICVLSILVPYQLGKRKKPMRFSSG
ncbi:MAG: hypothetical protein KKD01_09005 [Proteobacteria bacterium]|nr:hypothetical protein [Pseudomonadota bacterium]MBU1454847.1 hypothetical protein [Pseudomonadota bacterium]